MKQNTKILQQDWTTEEMKFIFRGEAKVVIEEEEEEWIERLRRALPTH